MRKHSTRSAIGWLGGALLGLVIGALPAPARAQSCSPAFDVEKTGGDAFGIVGSTYTVTVRLGAGTISGTGAQFLDINRLSVELDCQTAGFVGCTDETEVMAFEGNISTANCLDEMGGGVTWTASHAPGDTLPNTVVLTPDEPVRIPANTSADPTINPNACRVTYDVSVNSSPGTDATPLTVQAAAGYDQAAGDAVCTNGLLAGSQASYSFELCRTDCAENDTSCEAFECSTETGECVGSPVNEGGACTETSDPATCTEPACVAGECVAGQIAVNEGAACTETSDPATCTEPACVAGECVAGQIAVNEGAACTETPDPAFCTEPACVGGECVAGQIPDNEGEECSETTNPCLASACEEGTCVESCEPDGKPECEITLGDFIWRDANGDGLQDSETGIANVDLNLVECVNGEVVEATTTTNGSGAYGFTVTAVTNLETCEPMNREFLVEVDTNNFAMGGVLENLLGSPQDQGGDDGVDSDCDPDLHRTMCTAFPPGTTDLTIDCGFVPPVEGCLTRTPGFWCTHPSITQLFLPLESCGIDLTLVQSATPGSATEDLSFGNDHKTAGTSPQQLQLIRQCTAAALNMAASEANDGSCEEVLVSSGQTITDVFDLCCADEMLCDSGASGQTISGSGCIELLDEFNNSLDTLGGACTGGFCEGTTTACASDEECAPAPFDRPGPAEPGFCQDATGNGFVNPGRDLGPGTGPPAKGPNLVPKIGPIKGPR